MNRKVVLAGRKREEEAEKQMIGKALHPVEQKKVWKQVLKENSID